MSTYKSLRTICIAAVLSLGLAACGGGGGSGDRADPAPPPPPDLTPAQMAAATAASAAATAASEADTAATAAETAATNAENAANAQMANMAADEASYALAQNAAMRARTAATAAREAADAAMTASNAAAAAKGNADDAETLAAAQAAASAAATARANAESAKADADAAKGTADTEYANAMKYAQMVADAQQGIDDENQRMTDVASARSAAMKSYMDADADATKAETAATAAETAAPGSPGAMAARAAATAAREAANAAKAAHDAIMDGMTKAEADAKATEAANAASDANDEYMTAKRENDAIQTAKLAADEQQRVADVNAATSAAEKAAMAARTAATAARTSATNARSAADAAKASYEMAKAARTDMANAMKHYMDADAKATAAETAATVAETAASAAEAAHTGIDSAGSGADAKMAQSTAETEQGKAEMQRDMAMAAYDSDAEDDMGAKQLAAMAKTAAGTHVLGLLMNANPGDDADTEDVNEQAPFAMAVNTAAGAADNGSGGTTAAATWPADTPATDDAEAVPGMISITLSPEGGTALTFRTEAGEDDSTDPPTALPKTADMIAGLGGFTGYSISDGTTHAIVFTDKQQGTPAVTEVTAITASEHTNLTVDLSSHTITDLGSKSGTTYTGVTFYEAASVDPTADGHDAGNAFMGSLTCPSGITCNIQTDADGAVTAITGYQFTGSRAARAAVAAAAAAENTNYLAFGVWLQEDGDGNGTADDPAFGAFADGGSDFATPATLTGSATYNGKATGVYTAGSSVDYFQGDATLSANFGTPPETGDDTNLGSVTGMIDSIVAGGTAMDDVIILDAIDGDAGTDGVQNITATGAINGRARMGDGMTDPVTGVVSYTYTGSWSGQFHGPAAADDAEGVDTLPPAVAGTFGVTGTMGEGDDAMTRSYVGAFGARR